MRRELTRLRACIAVVGLALAAAWALAGGAAAEPARGATEAGPRSETLAIGYADLSFIGTPINDELGLWLDRAAVAGADRVRVNLYWETVAPTEPADPRDPEDPAYEFGVIDRTLREAAARGLGAHLTILSAPLWAEGPGPRPSFDRHRAGTWRPRPSAARDFGAAFAQRYGGAHPDPEAAAGESATLPRALAYEIWNEPNYPNYLAPQRDDDGPLSPALYRGLLNAFDEGIRSSDPDATIVTGGTAPYGATTSASATGGGVRPLKFWTAFFCLDRDLERLPDGCRGADRPRFDVFGHHPINTRGGPLERGPHPDDVTTANLDELVAVLRAAERHDTVSRRKAPRPLWATELWWETDPPDPVRGISPLTQARWMQQALREVWAAGGEAAYFLQVGDTSTAEDPEQRPFRSYQTGVYYRDGRPKPALTGSRFPFVVAAGPGGEPAGWTVAPRGGELSVERWADGAWQQLAGLELGAGEAAEIPLTGLGAVGQASQPVWIRARADGFRSLPFAVGAGLQRAPTPEPPARLLVSDAVSVAGENLRRAPVGRALTG